MKNPVDFKKRDKYLYAATEGNLTKLDVPELNFLAVSGHGGDPASSPEFSAAIEQMYGFAYTIKFMLKEIEDPEIYAFVVPPMECLWWNPDDLKDNNDPSKMYWQLLMRQADFVTNAHVDEARERMRKKGKLNDSELELTLFDEGTVAQTLHVGPYSEELRTIKKLHELASEDGIKLGLKHHEIYLSDPRRVQPENLRTIIRYPIVEA